MVELTSFVDHFPYLGIFLLLILGGIGLPFPEDATLFLAGFLIAHNMVKIFPTFLVVYISLLTSDFFLYLVGKKYGRSIVEHKRFHRILSLEKLSILEEKFKKWSTWVVFFGRHILGLRAQIFLIAGVMKISAIKFIIADGISALFTIGLWGGVGYVGGNSIQVLKKDVTRVEHIVILVLALLLMSWVVFRYFKNRRGIGKKKE